MIRLIKRLLNMYTVCDMDIELEYISRYSERRISSDKEY
jgi:hypothetical protein